MSDTKQFEQPKSNGLGYETTDANIGALAKFGIGLLVVTAIALVLMALMLNFFQGQKEQAKVQPHPLAERLQAPPQPRLQVKPDFDYAAYHAQQDSILNSYGWVQKEAGVIHIPIDSAMALVLKRGFPARNEE